MRSPRDAVCRSAAEKRGLNGHDIASAPATGQQGQGVRKQMDDSQLALGPGRASVDKNLCDINRSGEEVQSVAE